MKSSTTPCQLFATSLCLLFLALTTVAFADDATNGNTGGGGSGANESPTLTKTSNLNAVRLSVANGVIDFYNNARRAVFLPEWELLPTDKNLAAEARENNVAPVMIPISNESLFTGTWISGLKPEHKKLLEDAFRVSDLSQISQSSTEFQNFWVKDSRPGARLAAPAPPGVPAISAYQYFGLMRDYLQVSGLLQTKGIRYSVDVTGATPRGGNHIASNSNGSDIRWKLYVYKFQPTPTIAYYRFAVTAKMDPLTLLFPDTRETEADIDFGISFVKSAATIGLLNPNLRSLPGGVTIKLDPVAEKQLDAIDANHSASDLETTLTLIGGGAQLGEIVSHGLWGGTSKASVIVGGLVGSGKVSQVIGVNQEFSHLGKSSVGVLIGVEPGGDNSLFIGPSLQSSVFTLSTGFRLYEKDKASGGGKKTTSGFAGVVSVDLSRLSGSKKTVETIQLDNSTTGGDIGKASDLISRDLALVKWTLTGLDPTASFSLIQVEDGNGKVITDTSKQTQFDITGSMPQTLFIPRGRYEYQKIPQGYALSADGAPIQNGSKVLFSGKSVINVSWTLALQPPA